MIDLSQKHHVGLSRMPPPPVNDGLRQQEAEWEKGIRNMDPGRIARIRAMAKMPHRPGSITRQFGLSQWQLRMILDDMQYRRIMEA